MKMKKTNQLATILLFFAIVFAVFSAINLVTTEKAVDISDLDEISQVDFASEIAVISTDCYERYPSQLYTPRDFALGLVTQEPSEERPVLEKGFGTYRMVLRLEPGHVYGISAYSATYSQKLWIDGELILQVGAPGESAETTESKTGYYTKYFLADEETEIVIQRAAFVHAKGGRVYPLYLGGQDIISLFSDRILVRGSLVAGCCLMACLFLFGIYLFFRNYSNLLWFSLACLMIAIYLLFIDYKLIMTLFPEMPWHLSSRLEYISAAGTVFFYFMFAIRMFRLKIWSSVNIFGIFVLVIYLALVLFTPSIIYTEAMPYLRGGGVIYGSAALFLMGRSVLKNPANQGAEYYLILSGTFVFIFMTIIGIFLHSANVSNGSGLFSIGLIILIFADSLALGLSFTQTEKALLSAKRSEVETQEINKLLTHLNSVKSNFLADISHEMRTPLTVMSSYAGLSQMELKRGLTNQDTETHLEIIQREAVRLGRLVEQIKEISFERGHQQGLFETTLKPLLERAANFCAPICQKNGNSIAVSVIPELLSARINSDGIFQILINLIANANRHTRNDSISLTAQAGGGAAILCVCDHGDGIAPDRLPYIFERGVSGDGSSGLGLAICREIVEDHGGSINVESEREKGTRITITLPAEGELP